MENKKTVRCIINFPFNWDGRYPFDLEKTQRKGEDRRTRWSNNIVTSCTKQERRKKDPKLSQGSGKTFVEDPMT
jgi:hypothetical protein